MRKPSPIHVPNFTLIHSVVFEQLQFVRVPVVDHGYKFTMGENIEQRVAIKFCFKAGMGATKLFKILRAYGESTISCTQAFSLYNRFKGGNID